MSYEGYDMVLCELGHVTEYYAHSIDNPTSLSVYSGMHDDGRSTWKCPYCSSKLAWSTSVDETNGIDETGLCPGDVILEIKEEPIFHTCSCGHVHQTSSVTYKIPEKGIGTHY